MFAQLPLVVQIIIVLAGLSIALLVVLFAFLLPLITIWRGGKAKVNVKSGEIDLEGDPNDAPAAPK